MARAIGGLPWPAQWRYRTVRRRKEQENWYIVDVAVIQSLQRKGIVEDFVADYGHVIVDECHHLSAFTFERVLRQVKLSGYAALGYTVADSPDG